MSDDGVVNRVTLIAVTSLIWFCIYAVTQTAEKWRRECILRGVAEYAVDENGDAVWQWKEVKDE